METLFSFLEKRVGDSSSLLCIGLDPHPGDLPTPTAGAALDFCLRLIEETLPYAAAFKPNAAFFELYGPEGWAALRQVIETIHTESTRAGSRVPVILDAKRGDIASTAGAYAQSAFQTLGADCITLNPYLGKDSLTPFLAHPAKGIFLLCKTSNPGAADLQDLWVTGDQGRETGSNPVLGPRSSVLRPPSPVYLHLARLAQSWNIPGSLGLVVGATHPEALARTRLAAPGLWFLAPGVGAQGGDLEAALRAGLRSDGLGMLLPVSRGISRAESPARAARGLRDQIANIQYKITNSQLPISNHNKSGIHNWELASALLTTGCVKFGDFTLKSGLRSPIYIDLRQIISYPKLLEQIAAAYLPVLRPLSFVRLAGLPYAAIPIATAISLAGNYPMIYPRKEAKVYGTKAEIEGEYHAGETVVVIDDLATTGESKFEAIEKLAGAGLIVTDVVVLIDRQSGAKEALEQAGFHLHAVFTITQLLDDWEAAGKVEKNKIEATREFLKGN